MVYVFLVYCVKEKHSYSNSYSYDSPDRQFGLNTTFGPLQLLIYNAMTLWASYRHTSAHESYKICRQNSIKGFPGPADIADADFEKRK